MGAGGESFNNDMSLNQFDRCSLSGRGAQPELTVAWKLLRALWIAAERGCKDGFGVGNKERVCRFQFLGCWFYW
jgi:hypothetical protein